MNIERLREFCIKKPFVTESFPFDKTSLVFKVFDKIFLIASLDDPFFINAKCDPEKALTLRENHVFIKPGYHMNKKHWNSIYLDDCFNDELIYDLIDHSYNLVVSKLPLKQKVKIS